MNTIMKRAFFLLCLIIPALVFISCEDDDPVSEPDPGKTDKNGVSIDYVNKWIHENMSVYYLWNTKIPSSRDYTLDPDDFFDSICYWYDKNHCPDGDRFSWIQEDYVDLMNSLNGVSSDELGFDFNLYLLDEEGYLIGEILYVKKGTQAEKEGLKRGDLFYMINNVPLSIFNYVEIFSSTKGSFSMTLVDVIEENGNSYLTPGVTLRNLTTMSSYVENPVYYSNTYSIGGKKIGYLVYNFFAPDRGNNSGEYDAQLNDVFENFKSNNVTSVVLDLRYNSGGALSSSCILSSMLVKNLSKKEIFLKAEYNNLLTNEIKRTDGNDAFNVYFSEKVNGKTITNIGDNLEHICILTGEYTASASEMLINGLMPYMSSEITLIGDTTIGKNVGSITLYDEDNSKNKWGIQPIIAKFYNSAGKSDFTAGFSPEIYNPDLEINKKELGDPNEALLKEAINHITGRTTLKSKVQTNSYVQINSSLEKKAWRNTTRMDSPLRK